MGRFVSLSLAAAVGWMLACGSAGFCGHGHSSHGSTHAAASDPKPPHQAPKHPAAKPSKPEAHKPQAMPKGHESHKAGAAKPTAKPNGGTPKERTSNSMAVGPKSHEKSHEHDHEHHHDHDHHHDHHHWHGDHEWVGGVEVDGATVTDGSSAVVVPVDGAVASPAVVPDTAAPIASIGRQIQFSVDLQERDSYKAAARAAGMSRSECIRSRLNAAVSRELK